MLGFSPLASSPLSSAGKSLVVHDIEANVYGSSVALATPYIVSNFGDLLIEADSFIEAQFNAVFDITALLQGDSTAFFNLVPLEVSLFKTIGGRWTTGTVVAGTKQGSLLVNGKVVNTMTVKGLDRSVYQVGGKWRNDR